MATQYNLQPHEVVLLKDESARHEGSRARRSGELILTNLNLVFIEMSMFGKPKAVLTFPVNQIKVYNEQAQAVIGKARNGTSVLEVYSLNGEEKFSFQSGGKKKLNEWVSKIHLAVTGLEAQVQQASGMAIPGTELVAGVLKDTFGVFKSKFGSKPEAPANVVGKCRTCGAPATGIHGQAHKCEYCGTVQQL